MALRSRQKLWKRVAYSWITIVLLMLAGFFLVGGVINLYHKNTIAKNKAQSVQAELAKVVKRDAILKSDLAHIKTSRGVEGELRRKFDVARKGEHLLVIVDKEVEQQKVTIQEHWWQKLWRKAVE